MPDDKKVIPEGSNSGAGGDADNHKDSKHSILLC